MILKIYRVCLLGLLIPLMTESSDDLYPDLSCLPDLQDEPYGGIGYIKQEAEFCRKISNSTKEVFSKWENCKKSCVLSSLGIANTTTMEFDPVTNIAGVFHVLLFKNSDTALQVAERVHSCEGSYKAVAHLDCDLWDDFYSCMEKAWGC